MNTAVKICGIREPESLKSAIAAGARFIGFVFYPPSPRFVARETAKELALMLPTGVKAVGLFVDPLDADLEQVLGHVQMDMIQLHGSETRERVAEIKARFAMPVMKALAVSSAKDIENAAQYEAVADWVLFDAKAAEGNLPGGTGKNFDWSLLQGKAFQTPWMLSGGLNADNVVEALSMLHPAAVDVSSGVESARGVKDPAKIRAFIEAVKGL